MKVVKVVAWVGIGVMVGTSAFAFFVCIATSSCPGYGSSRGQFKSSPRYQ